MRVLVEEKYPELNKLIQTGKERGFIMYEELYDNLPEEVTGIAEELDDIYMRLSELDIDVVDAETAEAAAEAREGERGQPQAEGASQPAKTEGRPAAGADVPA
jgi:RNA polymerase primary sigma factor